jgi:hypothetical protein
MSAQLTFKCRDVKDWESGGIGNFRNFFLVKFKVRTENVFIRLTVKVVP